MKKAKTPPVKHNLGGVHLHHSTWLQIKARFEKQRLEEESFSAWVRRKLASS